MDKVLWISIGAVLGANLRYWVGDWAAQRFGSDFPYGTLMINLTGSFLLGLVVSITMEHFIIDPRLRTLYDHRFSGFVHNLLHIRLRIDCLDFSWAMGMGTFQPVWFQPVRWALCSTGYLVRKSI